MKRIIGLALLVLSSSVLAHEHVIKPVQIDISVEPSVLRVRIVSDAIFWLDDVLDLPPLKFPPANDWPAAQQETVKNYISAHWAVAMDGRPLELSQFVCAFRKEPFASSARMIFDLTYDIESPGKTISGAAHFFDEVLEAKVKKDPDIVHEFFSEIRVLGRKPQTIIVPADKKNFEFSLEDAVTTPLQLKTKKIKTMTVRLLSSPFFWIVVIFTGVKVTRRLFRKEME